MHPFLTFDLPMNLFPVIRNFCVLGFQFSLYAVLNFCLFGFIVIDLHDDADLLLNFQFHGSLPKNFGVKEILIDFLMGEFVPLDNFLVSVVTHDNLVMANSILEV
jgi:hypothetical protein